MTKPRLTPGADWERYIEESLDWGSAASSKFLLLLIPHSVRRPNGYCLNDSPTPAPVNCPSFP